MPYRRKYYKKKKQGRVQIYGRAGKQLYKDVMYLKTLVNSEPHNFTAASSNNIDSTGVVISLNDIAVGDGITERTGTSLLPRWQSLNLTINKKITPAGTVDHETYRIILFRYWGEASSAAPAVTLAEVLQSSVENAFLNDDNTGSKGDRERRIEVHKSKFFTLDSVAQTARVFKWNVAVNGPQKKVKEHIKYRTQNTEQPVSGGFYLLIMSDNATGANKSAYKYNSKLVFYDN